jgi:hypothetical protein
MNRSSFFRRRRGVAALAALVLTGLVPLVSADTAGAAGSYPLYSSHALDGTFGTPPMVTRDPDHPHRQLCYKSPCTAKNAAFAEEVRTMALDGNRLFLGGFFHGLVDGSRSPVSPKTAFLAVLDASNGRQSDQAFALNAAPNGTVESFAVSPERNRLYVGGRFSRIGGGSANRLAALDLRTGKLDPTFKAPALDGDVRSIALSGGRLFIGGQFLRVGSTKFAGVAALDAGDGSLVPGWTPPTNNGGSFIKKAGTATERSQGIVYTIAVAAGGRLLIVGGTFQHLGSTRAEDPKAQRYGGLIALNTSDGRVASWRPRNDRPVFGLAVAPNSQTAYTAAGGSGGWVQAFSPGGQDGPRWTGRVDGDVLGITATDKRIYVGGHFDAEVPNLNDDCLKHIPTHCVKTGSHHRHLVAFNTNGKADSSWTAQADTPEGPTFLLAGPKALYVGGNFTNTLDKSALDGGKGIQHPGFALFPAKG